MRLKSFSFVVAALVLSQSAMADAGFTVKTGYDFTSGKYGTDTRTEITSIPFIASYETGNWTFKGNLPYVRITGADNVISGVGAVNKNATGVRTASGLGDITTAATYSLLSATKTQPGVDLTAKIKFGTADKGKALGTGENDVWVLVDAYQPFGKFTLLGGIGYGRLGSSETLKLNNVISGNIGGSYKISEQASVGAILDLRTKSTDNGYDQRELTAYYSHKLGGGYKMQAYATKGFSDGSPDYGVGVNVGYNF